MALRTHNFVARWDGLSVMLQFEAHNKTFYDRYLPSAVCSAVMYQDSTDDKSTLRASETL